MVSTCSYCGNNPVPHRLTKIGTSISAYLRPPRHDSLLQCFSAKAAQRCLQAVIGLFVLFGIARVTHDSKDALSARGEVLWEEAKRRGIAMHGYRVFGRKTDAYRAKVKGRSILFNGMPRPLISKSGSEWWLDDKATLKKKLIAANIPVSRGGRVDDLSAARSLFNSLEKPLVIKPAVGSRGRHTTTHIYTERELENAYRITKQLSRSCVLEEHLVGSVYRATIIDGQLVGVLGGDPPRIVSDGVSTIAALIERKNASRDPRISPVVLGESQLRFLLRLGYTSESILPPGMRIDVSEKIGIGYGGHSAEVTPTTHPETKRILTKAAEVVADPIIGFDFIIPDITKSPHEQRWGIIECNAVPFINLHHDPIEGTPVNVAKHVWDYVEAHIERF
ncbi:hypothetical protein COU18_00940 [Candidatus Kaiserbacteria bacterium CG10_big_fil_rev_8_21_14_0_10_51_14]|uniref:ATP-grasp domain-containing protein n=1 Tax=Candidatus Kaiserbacteria bacterium CG10_big_fil_rev_8_21_14_0_10_51_14 TaxID=1974610 RepID=A0A2H0UC09_9BACT|nr:MAG: hypothetical protein COU18_00940 [Candidatus Kaiserbacteria bacterium CG10_big_fil_rev_8_21_14_0_10_51_14]